MSAVSSKQSETISGACHVGKSTKTNVATKSVCDNDLHTPNTPSAPLVSFGTDSLMLLTDEDEHTSKRNSPRLTQTSRQRRVAGNISASLCAPLKKNSFDRQKYNSRIAATNKLKQIPKAPSMRNECIFMDKNYSRVVRQRKMEKVEADAERKLLLVQLNDDKDDIVAQKALMREEELVHCQEQWLVLVQLASFANLMTKASETAAMSVLRTLLAPIVRRVRNNMRKQKRQAVIMENFLPLMRPVTVELLQQHSAFSWWDLESLEKAAKQFVACGVAADVRISGEGSYEFGVAIVDQGTVEVTKKFSLLEKTMNRGTAASKKAFEVVATVEPLEDRKMIEGTAQDSFFGELSVLSPRSPNPVGYKAGNRRVLYWHLPGSVYATLRDGLLTDPAEKVRAAKLEARSNMVPLLYKPTPQALQNCGRNRLFAPWNDSQLEQLSAVLTPKSYLEGDVILTEGESSDTCFFLANGVVDVTKQDITTGQRHGRKAESFRRTYSNTGGRSDGTDTASPGGDPQNTSLMPSPIYAASPTHNQQSTIQRDASSRHDGTGSHHPTFVGAAHEDTDSIHDGHSQLERLSSFAGGGTPRVVATLGPWQSMGDEGIVTLDRRSGSVVAKTDVDGWSCCRKDLFQILGSDPSLHLKVKEQVASMKAERFASSPKEPLQVFLADHPILSMCTPDEIKALAQRAQPKWFAAHDTISSSQHETPIFVIITGIARTRIANIHRQMSEEDEKFPRTFGRGAVLAAAACIMEGAWYYPFVVEAQTPVEGWEISCADVQDLLKNSTGMKSRSKNAANGGSPSANQGAPVRVPKPPPSSPPSHASPEPHVLDDDAEQSSKGGSKVTNPTISWTNHHKNQKKVGPFSQSSVLTSSSVASVTTLHKLRAVAGKVARSVTAAIHLYQQQVLDTSSSTSQILSGSARKDSKAAALSASTNTMPPTVPLGSTTTH